MHGKIFIIMGKSGTGKSTIMKYLLDMSITNLKVFQYGTTRPKRGEDDNEYTFVSDEEFKQLLSDGKVLEYRVYNTVFGSWTYFTYNHDINLDKHNYIMVGTWDVYCSLKKVFKRKDLVPIMLKVPNKEELWYRIAKDRAEYTTTQEETNKALNEAQRRMKQDDIDFSKKRMFLYWMDILFHEGAIVINENLRDTKRDILGYVLDIIGKEKI